MSWCRKSCHAILSRANGVEACSFRLYAMSTCIRREPVRLSLMIWAMGNRVVGSEIADSLSIVAHRLMMPALYTTQCRNGGDLQKLLMASSYTTFPMRQPFEARVAHQKLRHSTDAYVSLRTIVKTCALLGYTRLLHVDGTAIDRECLWAARFSFARFSDVAAMLLAVWDSGRFAVPNGLPHSFHAPQERGLWQMKLQRQGVIS